MQSLNVNRVTLGGYLTSEVEIRRTPRGESTASAWMAPGRRRKASGEPVPSTFVMVNFWGPVADMAAQTLRKGQPLLIEGRLRTDEWIDDDGTKRSRLSVNVERLHMVGVDAATFERDDARLAGNLAQGI